MHTSDLNIIKVLINFDLAAPVHFIGIRVALGELGINPAGDYHPLPVETLLSLNNMDTFTHATRTLGLLCVLPSMFLLAGPGSLLSCSKLADEPCGTREKSALIALSISTILGPLGSRWSRNG